ncbi:hypothetical protein PYCCODRAFT_816499 [Trametes coccinea BRFM310]|uniref:Uncharacterized protein n=1 Tax=Trametes coccinea (strain BRFM310) TaxID=1353009 RepID=A0A1Y2II43_TRAC3|nr:hypothetical protein PYCCODRAFT_816499 [Trametes coccinea BRFM310]
MSKSHAYARSTSTSGMRGRASAACARTQLTLVVLRCLAFQAWRPPLNAQAPRKSWESCSSHGPHQTLLGVLHIPLSMGRHRKWRYSGRRFPRYEVLLPRTRGSYDLQQTDPSISLSCLRMMGQGSRQHVSSARSALEFIPTREHWPALLAGCLFDFSHGLSPVRSPYDLLPPVI